mmetsp:Transcript_55610/g.92111  ORF Transcript_55610/g.92111 Transcript_55610/m.92111 type:complete len:524 (+) Transcript_55610:112-1683(+)
MLHSTQPCFHSCQESCFAFRPPTCHIVCGERCNKNCCAYWSQELSGSTSVSATQASAQRVPFAAVYDDLAQDCSAMHNATNRGTSPTRRPLATLFGQPSVPAALTAIVHELNLLDQTPVRPRKFDEGAASASSAQLGPRSTDRYVVPPGLYSPGPYCFSFVAELETPFPIGMSLLGPTGTLCLPRTMDASSSSSLELGWWLGRANDRVPVGPTAFYRAQNDACTMTYVRNSALGLQSATSHSVAKMSESMRRHTHERALLILHRWGGYFQHFMQDILWRLLNAHDVLNAQPDYTIVLEYSSIVQRILHDVLALPPTRVRWWGRGAAPCVSLRSRGRCELHNFRHLVISSAGPRRWQTSIIPTWGRGPELLRRWVSKDRCEGHGRGINHGHVLLLQRERGTQRWLANGKEVLVAMRRVVRPPSRVRMLQPKDYRQIDQLRVLFPAAIVFVAPHGGQVPNILFGCPDTHVIEISPTVSYESMLIAFGFHYWPLKVQGKHDAAIRSLAPKRVEDVLALALNTTKGA